VANSDKRTPPDTSLLEGFVAAAKLASAAIPVPFVGVSIAEAVGYFGQREIDKRQSTFFAEVLRGLQDMQVQVADLKESFWSTLLYAVDVARRTHQQEKREALKNAVLNAAKPTAPEDDVQHIFVTMVDDLTPLHLRLLDFILNPRKYGVDVKDWRGLQTVNPKLYGVWEVIEQNVAGSSRRDLIDLCFSDMVSRGLLRHSTAPPALRGPLLPGPTNLALEFMSFITASNQQAFTSAEGEG